MPDFLQKIAIDWSPAKQSTQEFVNSIIAEVQRIQRLPLTQQRSELSSGAQAITGRVQSLGEQGILDPRAVERTLAQTLAPIRSAQANVTSGLVEVQAARRADAARIRADALKENAANEQFRKDKADAAATVRRVDQQARTDASEQLKVDRAYIAARAEQAANDRKIALETKAAGLGIPGQGRASGATVGRDPATGRFVKVGDQSAAEADQAFEARIVVAERLKADRQRLANAKQLSKLSAEEVAVEAETAVIERQRQRALNAATQQIVSQRIESGQIAGGTTFQQIQRALASRQGGPAKLPEEYQSLGQFVGSKLVTTAGFALSGAAAYGALTSLKEIYSSEKDIQQAFTIIQGQLNEIGQGGSLSGVRADIAGIAGDTGTAEALIAQIFPQIEGAFHNTRVALDDARTASEVAKITKTDLAATVNSMVPASIAFGVNFKTISDTAFGIQERAGVAANRTIELFGAVGPVARQAGLSIKETGAIAAAVLQDTTRAPQNVAEDLNRLIPQLQTRTPLIHAALQQAGQGATASEFVKDISSGKTGAAIGLLIASYNKLGPAEQQALEAATGSGRGTKDIVDLLLNQKVALDELNPALDDAGKTSKYFSDLQRDLGQQASQVKEQLLQLGRALLESGAANALGDILVGVALLVHGLGDLATWFADLNRLSHGFLGQLLEIAVAAKALQLLLTNDKLASLGKIALNKLPGVNIGGAETVTPQGPETEFATAVNQAGETFLATVTKASETVAAALSGGGEVAKDELAIGGQTAAVELETGGAGAKTSMLLGGQGIVAAIAGYMAYRATQQLLGTPQHPTAAGRFEDRALNDTVAPIYHAIGQIPGVRGREDYKNLRFAPPSASALDDQSYDQVHQAISELGAGLQQGAGGALSNDEEKRIAEDLKATKSKNIDVVLASIQDLNRIYSDLKQRNPAAATAVQTAKTAAAAAAGNAAELTPDATTGVAPLETDVENALAGYANGASSLAEAIAAAQQKLAGLPTNDPRVLAAQQKVNKVISDALLQDQQLADSLTDSGVAGQQAKIGREVALFNLPQFSDAGDRLALAKQVVSDLKAELTAEADAATSAQERNRILAAGLQIPPEVRQVLGQQIIDTDPLLQGLLASTTVLDKTVTDSISKDTANLVAGGKAVGDAYILALQQQLAFLRSAEGVVGATDADGSQLAQDIAQVQHDLDAAVANRNALNIQPGVPTTVTGPPQSQADKLSQQDALNKANADLASAKAGGNKEEQARIAQRLAQQDYDAALASKDDVKIAQALAEKERANQQLAAAQNDELLANDNYQTARDQGDPLALARDARKIADDKLDIARRSKDAIGALQAEADQMAADRQMASAMADLGTAQMNLLKAQLEAAGDVIGVANEQVAIIQKQIADFMAQHPNATLGNSAELNNLQASLVNAQTDASKSTVSFTEQRIQDNLDLQRITVGQAVAQLRALEALQKDQTVRDEIEKRIRSLLGGAAGDLKMNLPAEILPTLYEARRLNTAAGGYQPGSVDQRSQTFIFQGYDQQEVAATVAAAAGSTSQRFGTTSRRY